MLKVSKDNQTVKVLERFYSDGSILKCLEDGTILMHSGGLATQAIRAWDKAKERIKYNKLESMLRWVLD